MPSLPVLTVRIPSELQKRLKARAKSEGKTVSELTVELLTEATREEEEATLTQYREHEDIHQHLDYMLTQLIQVHGELLWKGATAAAEARYYARLAAMYTEGIGGPGGRLAEVDQACKEEAKRFLKTPPESD